MRIKEKITEVENVEKMKIAFLHNMSHEIRTPLNSIIGFMQLLDTDVTAEEHKVFIKIIHQNTELLVRMIDNMLLMSALESGEYQVEPIAFDISSFLHDLSESIKGIIHDDVRLNIIRHEPLYVSLDKNSIIRVLKALILNADKFTQTGSITVDYNVGGDMLNVLVTDTGIGIAKKNQKKIFGKFEKLDQFSQGLGLGLPICKAIAEKLGGSIGVQSKLGYGSTFRFSIPLLYSSLNKEILV
ncbi:sensor histidine kinase [Xylanibacter oryzae]|uniref:sensor histidine kinase n=1 Tax=Xylanibacter oryzae TaxID=185293 RepID=UPI0004B7E282|nr:HAMP domain-containing sensor histidine kinase [Xylanibacter oryzae]